MEDWPESELAWEGEAFQMGMYKAPPIKLSRGGVREWAFCAS